MKMIDRNKQLTELLEEYEAITNVGVNQYYRTHDRATPFGQWQASELDRVMGKFLALKEQFAKEVVVEDTITPILNFLRICP